MIMKLLNNRRTLGILIVLVMAATLLVSVCAGCNSKDNAPTTYPSYPLVTGGLDMGKDEVDPGQDDEVGVTFPTDIFTTPSDPTGEGTTPTGTEPTGSATEPTSQPTEPTVTPTQPTEPPTEATDPTPTQPTETMPPVTEPDDEDTGEGGWGDIF